MSGRIYRRFLEYVVDVFTRDLEGGELVSGLCLRQYGVGSDRVGRTLVVQAMGSAALRRLRDRQSNRPPFDSSLEVGHPHPAFGDLERRRFLYPEEKMRGEGLETLPGRFSLGLTLLCGQCFRWQGPDVEGWFEGVAGGAFWRLRQQGDGLHWRCSAENIREEAAARWINRYLGLDEDLSAWETDYAHHPVLETPLRTLRGLRLLRQEPWECLVSYMFAQGLSVQVIRGTLRKFCARYGEKIEDAPGFYAFPSPWRLAGLSASELKPFTNNYYARADRIIRAARVMEAGVISLGHLKTLSCDEARAALMGLDGIGSKIADCILLFSLDQASAFPVDRWVLRAMKRHFRSVKLLGAGGEAPTAAQYPKIVAQARRHLGERCGLASEYLFLFLRLLEDPKLRGELAPYLNRPLPESLPSPTGRRGKSTVKKTTI